MTAYTITTAKNLDELAGKAGGDTYAINGATLTIDGDTRFDLNQTTTATLGTATISSTLGGNIEVDGRFVRLIPFTGGSGTATLGATINCDAATGKIIGIYSALNAAPVLTDVAAGWIKVKQWNGTAFPTSGAFTQGGYTFTISGADTAGWIEVVGDDSAVTTITRLGSFRARGEWFEVGSTSGDRASTYQLPTNGGTVYFPGVWVNGEFYPNAGSLVAAGSIGTDAVRGKVCWISTAGVLRLGNDGTNSDTGYLPAAGLAIRLPNVILQNCATAARTVNTANAMIASRHGFYAPGAAITMDKVCVGWYMAFTLSYSVNLSYVGVPDRINLNTILSPLAWDNVGVGMSAALTAVPLEIAACPVGGTINNSVFVRATQTSNWDVIDITDSALFSFDSVRAHSLVNRGSTGSYSLYMNRCTDMTCVSCTFGGSPVSFLAALRTEFRDTVYFDVVSGTTTTANAMSAISIGANTSDCLIDGLTFGGLTNCQPYYWAVYFSNYNTSNITVQNIGTQAAPLSLGTVNASSGIVGFFGYSYGTKIRRVYVANPRSYGLSIGPYTVLGVAVENVSLGYATTPSFGARGMTAKGLCAAAFDTSGSALIGSCFIDGFTSSTAGVIQFNCNEPSAENASYVTTSNGAAFTGAGYLSQPAVGMSATWEMPYFALGHLSLVRAHISHAGTYTAGMTPFDLTFCVDKNDGAGFGEALPATAVNLAAVSGIDAAKGIKLRLTLTTNTATTITNSSVRVITASSTDAQAYQYPLEVATVIVDGLASGSMVKASKVSDGTILFTGLASAGAVSFSTDYAGALAIEARKASSAPYYRPWQSQVTTVLGSTVTATAVQQLDE